MFLAVSRVVMLRALLGYSGKGSSAFPIFVGHGSWFVYGLGGFVLGCVSRGRICLVSSPGLQVWAWSGVCRGGVAGLIVFLAMCFLLVTISLDPFPPLLYTVLSCAHAALVGGGEESLCVPLAVVVPARVQLWGWLISR